MSLELSATGISLVALPLITAQVIALVALALLSVCALECFHYKRRVSALATELAVASIALEESKAQTSAHLGEDLRIEEQLQLADRMTSLGNLVAGVTHELNNPMSYVLPNLAILREDVEALALPKEQTLEFGEMLEETETGCVRISAIVRGLQQFARATSSEQEERVSVSVDRACAITGSTVRSLACLHVEIAEDLQMTKDGAQLTHVLVNLLLNAANSVREKQGDKQDNRVDLFAFRDSLNHDALIIEVRDSGTGLLEGQPERVVAASSDPSGTTEKSTNLGLPICQSIVSAMGGEIEIERTPGKGSTVRVQLHE